MTPEILSQISPRDVIYIAFIAGVLWAEFRVVKKAIDVVEKKVDRLDLKVEKHNGFDRRLVRVETKLGIEGTDERKVD